MSSPSFKNREGFPILIFLISQITSSFGSSVVSYTIIWYITLNTSSPVALSLTVACTYIPQIVISIFSGVLADKFNKKNMIIIGDAITGLSTLLVAIPFIRGYHSLPVIYGGCIMRAIGTGIQSPATNAFLPLICPKNQLQKVNGIYSTAASATHILSPAAAGLLLAGMDFGQVLILDCITAILAIMVMTRLQCIHTNPSTKAESMILDSLTGIQYFRQHKYLGKLVSFYLGFYFLMSAPAFLTPMIVSQKFNGTVNDLAINEMVWSVGTMVGGVISCSITSPKKSLLMTLSCLAFGCFIFLLGITRIFPLYLLFMICSGVSLPIFSTTNTTLIQKNTKTEMLGRTFANLNILSTTAMTIGILFFGILGTSINVDILLSIVGLCISLLSILIWRL